MKYTWPNGSSIDITELPPESRITSDQFDLVNDWLYGEWLATAPPGFDPDEE